MGLFDLDDETVRQLSALLSYGDLDELTSVSTAARQSHFRMLRDARLAILILPPADEECARALLQGCTLARLSCFKWIQVETPWHIDLLVECGLEDCVRSLRVVNMATDSSQLESSGSLGAKLPLLTGVTKLHVRADGLTDVAPISRMHQLRALDFTQTPLTDMSSLSALTQLETLEITCSGGNDLSFLADMLQLRTLKVSSFEPSVRIPSLLALTKLRYLKLFMCTVDSDDALLSLAATLDYLEVALVTAQGSPPLDYDYIEGLTSPPRYAASDHEIDWGINVVVPRAFSRISRLELTSCTLSDGRALSSLAPFIYLEELRLLAKDHFETSEFDILLQLPRLASLRLFRLPTKNRSTTTRSSSLTRWNNSRDKALGVVLSQMPQLKRLIIRGSADVAVIVPVHIEHLSVGVAIKLTTFDWICSHCRLCSLWIANLAPTCDLSGIGSLTGLEELHLSHINVRLESHGNCSPGAQWSFLRQLVKIKTLHLDLDHFHDASVLSGMRNLKVLMIKSTCRVLPIKNVNALVSLPRLRRLVISSTPIVDVASFAHAPRLCSLQITEREES